MRNACAFRLKTVKFGLRQDRVTSVSLKIGLRVRSRSFSKDLFTLGMLLKRRILRFSGEGALKRHFTVIVWRPFEHISAHSSKTVDDREKVFLRVTCRTQRELPFGDMATAHRLTARPVEARVCIYPIDRPTDPRIDRLTFCTPITRKRFDQFRSFKHCRKAFRMVQLQAYFLILKK